ncbi:MAG TPA: hypothetical protein VNT57_00515 [Desulfobacteria bacterium]|nr:hypothetical protein [Desulfobacteria bacterium]
MQIGNIHFGKVETAMPPQLNLMEAALTWDLLVGRYKCIRETQIYHSYAHDPEWKALLDYGIDFLENQARVLEQQAKMYKLPLPDRPPLDAPLAGSYEMLQDRYTFSQVFEGCQSWIDFLARASRSMVTSDPLRHIMVDFLNSDLALFDKVVKFGKLKGWLEPSPVFRAN